MWIPSSFVDCLLCNSSQSLGCIVDKQNFHLIELCKICNHSKYRPFPKLNKKVIYLDQFFFSLAKDRSPSRNLFFQQAWEKLTELYRLQIIVCPFSIFHEIETTALQSLDSVQKLQKNYEELSGGIKFYDPLSIYKMETEREFLHWLRGENQLNIDDIVYGKRNQWLPSVKITNRLEAFNNNNRFFLEEKAKQLYKIIEIHMNSKNKTYKDIYNDIQQEFSVDSLNKGLPFKLEDYLYTKCSISFINALEQDFIKENMCKISSVKITSAFIAEIIYQEIRTNKSFYKYNDFYDINMIASIMPYCDAIFIDKQMYLHLTRPNHAGQVIPEFQEKLFSAKNIEHFLYYLENLNKEIPAMHKELVEIMYP